MIQIGRRSSYDPMSPLGPPPGLAAVLSRRQCEVAILVADGYCDKEIAKRLGISNSSIPTYVKRIARKLGCDEFRNSRIQITRAVIMAWAEAA